jgi:hypothetical protein
MLFTAKYATLTGQPSEVAPVFLYLREMKMNINFNLDVTVKSPETDRHDVTVQVRDADNITRKMISRPFAETKIEYALSYVITEALAEILDLVAQEQDTTTRERATKFSD